MNAGSIFDHIDLNIITPIVMVEAMISSLQLYSIANRFDS